ncbi:methylenetetrahydrofolate reductase [Candidatus Bathyarchaeota archaeon]|nr:methylenetetrahydrofolate reductase [Candidatus Bathyarchaeota archaeon]
MFRERLKENVTPITYEVWSPKGCEVNRHLEAVSKFKDKLDAVNVPDNPLSTLRVSSVAYAKIVMDHLKIDAIPHINCRDRNLLALQSDILGAHLLGIRNLFIIRGDKPLGRQEKAKGVWEVTSAELCKIVKSLNEGFAYYNERLIKINGKTDFSVGGAIVFDRKNEVKIISKKIEAGFDFFQSQITFNHETVLNFFQEAEKEGLIINKPVLVGLSPQPSEKALNNVLKFLHTKIPEQSLNKLKRSDDFANELIMMCLEIADEVKSALSPRYKIGFHIMPLGCDDLGRKLVEELRR